MHTITITVVDDTHPDRPAIVTATLDEAEVKELLARATKHRRDPAAHATVLIAQQLGLWMPDPEEPVKEPTRATTRKRPTAASRNGAAASAPK